MNKIYIVNFTRTITDGNGVEIKHKHICGAYSSAEIASSKIKAICDSLCNTFECGRETNNRFGTKFFRDAITYHRDDITTCDEYRIDERTIDSDFDVI